MYLGELPLRKTAKYRERLRAQGLRPVQIWVPDTRSKSLADEVRRQSLRVSRKDDSDLMDELDLAAAQTEDWEW
jgi:hypothetical protein